MVSKHTLGGRFERPLYLFIFLCETVHTKCIGMKVSSRTTRLHGRSAFRDNRSVMPINRRTKRNCYDVFMQSIWSLPEELLLQLLKTLHVKDLLNMRSTHPYFRDLINDNPSLWAHISFSDIWPSLPNIVHFEKAADLGNLEACVKLGVAYLYNEGLSGDFEGKKICANGESSAQLFCRVEHLAQRNLPFTWLFIRPPWATTGACCKECVFKNMKSIVQKSPDPMVHVCIAKTQNLLDGDPVEQQAVITHHLQQAASLGSQQAAFMLWQNLYSDEQCKILDQGGNLQRVRELRNIAVRGACLDSQLCLCREYIEGNLGGLSHSKAALFVQRFFSASKPTYLTEIFKYNELTHSMRYILVDWLVEVAAMKDFDSLTLHLGITLVDRYLRCHPTTRSKLQLLGVSAMVLCSRLLGQEIITIREAAWLTDNTYKYEDVVRMMGEITATLGGKFRVLTSLDYVRLINLAAETDARTSCLAEYYCEVVLLQSDLGCYTQAQLAAAASHLAQLTIRRDNPWSSKCVEFTGLMTDFLSFFTLEVHAQCFVKDVALKDYREVVLQAVKQRYAEADMHSVSSIPALGREELCTMLGTQAPATAAVPLVLTSPKHASPSFMSDTLITSPCRPPHNKMFRDRNVSIEEERENAATPSLDSIEERTESSFRMLNESHTSGYDADREDEGESFLDFDGYESDQDLESLWCADGACNSKPSLSQAVPHDTDSSLNYSADSFTSSPQSLLSCLPLPKSDLVGQGVSFHVPGSSYRATTSRPGQAASTNRVYFSPLGSTKSSLSTTVGKQVVKASPLQPTIPLYANVLASHNITRRVHVRVYEDPTQSPFSSPSASLGAPLPKQTVADRPVPSTRSQQQLLRETPITCSLTNTAASCSSARVVSTLNHPAGLSTRDINTTVTAMSLMKDSNSTRRVSKRKLTQTLTTNNKVRIIPQD